MDREILINKTIHNISLLPDIKLKEISDYIDSFLKSNNNNKITKGIMQLVSESESFYFLKEENDIYDESDLIEKF